MSDERIREGMEEEKVNIPAEEIADKTAAPEAPAAPASSEAVPETSEKIFTAEEAPAVKDTEEVLKERAEAEAAEEEKALAYEEAAAAAPAAEALKAETPKAEIPAAEAPKAEAPKAEPLKAEAPRTDTLKGETASYIERRASSSHIPEERSRAKSGSGSGQKIAGIVLAGILFGCVAGGTMAGVNILANRFANTQTVESQAEMQEETIAAGELAENTEAAGPAGETADQEIAAAETEAALQASIGNDVSSIVEKAMPSVVAINSKVVVTQNSWFFGKQTYEGEGSGSGILIGENDDEYLVATNAHVIEDATELAVTFIDGESVNALVKGSDSDADLAVIAIEKEDVKDSTKDAIVVAEVGDSDALKLGQGVVAIGNALGEGQSVTVGYVSALNKKVTIQGVERTLLQVDAAINPGNSGGALLNMKGEVIGINSAKLADMEIEGIGYAIPISQAQDIINDLMNKTTKVEVPEDEQGYIGIQLQNIDSSMAQMYGMPEGIYVYKILNGGAAAKSDLRERDIITRFDGETVKTGDDLQRMLSYYRGGTTVTLTVQSLENGSYVERKVDLTLGYRRDKDKLTVPDDKPKEPGQQ